MHEGRLAAMPVFVGVAQVVGDENGRHQTGDRQGEPDRGPRHSLGLDVETAEHHDRPHEDEDQRLAQGDVAQGEGAGAVAVGDADAGQADDGQRPAGLGHEIHADQRRQAEAGQRAPQNGLGCQQAAGDYLVRRLHLVLSGVGVVIGIFIGEVGAALHENRAD